MKIYEVTYNYKGETLTEDFYNFKIMNLWIKKFKIEALLIKEILI